MLYVGDAEPIFLRALRTIAVPPGDKVRIRLRADSCVDWDSSVAIRPGQTLLLGYRNPKCQP
jgi:hypothetical protein